jgi:hypothetical protein
MLTFEIVKGPQGWVVRLGSGVSIPFRSYERAVREADGLCDAIRRHGAIAEVVVEGEARVPADERNPALRSSIHRRSKVTPARAT